MEGLAHYEGRHTGQEGLDCGRKRASKHPSFMVSTCVPALTPLNDVPRLPTPTLRLVREHYQSNRKQMETYSYLESCINDSRNIPQMHTDQQP